MNTRIRPLLRHPMTLLAQLEVRSTQEVLDGHAMATNAQGGDNVLLNHPPTYLIRAEGGEEPLNEDAVLAQLGLYDKSSTAHEVPNTLMVCVIDPSSMQNITTRTLRFLFGIIQMLNYQSSDSHKNKLTDAAIDMLVKDEELKNSIEKDIFKVNTLEVRHFKVLFSSSRLQERTIGSLVKKYKENSPDQKDKNIPKEKSYNRKVTTNKNEKNDSNEKACSSATSAEHPATAHKKMHKDNTTATDLSNIYRAIHKAEKNLNIRTEEKD